MEKHHLLELGVGVGIVALVAIGTFLHQQASKVDTTGSSLKVATSGRVETLNSTTYSSLTASSTISATIVGLYARDAQGQIVSAISNGQRCVSQFKDLHFSLAALSLEQWRSGDRARFCLCLATARRS
ncbi:hypothetical protein [Lacticaseibacillus manihotivorans]|uniref:hypothetical protein n=1 Tax=Lacticaseibacillus manihotivorans TaxID=88233 RepID=UPI0006CF2596|nr:hypothetical protein [Lacticaseibacillus manihotivorans]